MIEKEQSQSNLSLLQYFLCFQLFLSKTLDVEVKALLLLGPGNLLS